MNLIATEFILMYLHLMKKKPYKKQLYWQSPTTFSPVLIIFFCTYVYEYTLSSNFENCHWINFPVIDVQFIMGQYFFLNQWYALLWFIWINYDVNDHFRERLQVDCIFFSTMVDLFKKRNSISPFETVITGLRLVLAEYQ